MKSPAPVTGRERSCAQCRATYRAPRSSSRFCSTACRVRHHRDGPPSDIPADGLFYELLNRLGYAGQIGPVNRKDPRPPVYGLTVPRAHAVAEWNSRYPEAAMADAVFKKRLKDRGIHDYDEWPVKQGR